MNARNLSISVIVPIYNEIVLIEQSIAHLSSFLETYISDYEILIIESGSTDGSGEASDRLAESLPNIKVIHEGLRSGFGSALRLGYTYATKELVWLVVVDLPFRLETILRALPLFDEYDCVFSYRIEDNRKILKRLRSIIYNIIARSILGFKVKHVNSAFRVFRREVIQSLHLISTGWTLDAEVIFEITRRKIPYTEIPVELIDRKVGNTSIDVTDPFFMIRELLAIRQKQNINGSP